MSDIFSSLGNAVRETSNFLVEEKTLAASATSITFTGLDGLADGGYTLEVAIIPGTSNNFAAGMCLNGDTNLANYINEYLVGSGTSTAANSAIPSNTVFTNYSATSMLATLKVDLFITNSLVTCMGIYRSNAVNEQIAIQGFRYVSLVSNISSITLQGYANGTTNTLSNCFGAGTVARLYRKKQGVPSAFPSVKGMLVADVVVPSATTSVTISGLDGNLHGGYDFEATIINATGSTGDLSIFFNNDTTSSNYYTQILNINDTTVVGARANASAFATLDANKSCYVKSNMNIINNKIYNMNSTTRGSDGSLMLRTTYITHVPSQQNITTITISSSIASSIATGSRFRLFRRI